jgi:glycerophosphoryl diester phosphodiesterase
MHRTYQVRVPLLFLTGAAGSPFADTRTYADYLTPAGLRDLSRYAQGIGPDKVQVIGRNADDTLGTPTTLVANAHRAGLKVIPYTFLKAGLDGLFTDQSDIGVLSRSMAFAHV